MSCHIAKHAKLVQHLMPDIERKNCVDSRLPYFYERLGSSYKYICCLICKTGHTCVNNGSAERWIAEHRYARACHSKFDDVRHLYAIDGPVLPMPPVVEMMTRPSHTMMDTCYKTFGFEAAEKCLPLDEQLRLVCMKYQQRNTVAAPPPPPAPPAPSAPSESLQQAMREAEADRLRILAERKAEVERENRAAAPIPPLAPKNVLTLLVEPIPNSYSEDDSEEEPPKGPDDYSRGIITTLGAALRHVDNEDLSRKEALCDDMCEEAYMRATDYINRYSEQHEAVQQAYDVYTEFINGDITIQQARARYNSITKSI